MATLDQLAAAFHDGITLALNGDVNGKKVDADRALGVIRGLAIEECARTGADFSLHTNPEEIIGLAADRLLEFLNPMWDVADQYVPPAE